MIRPMVKGDRQAYLDMASQFYQSDAVIKKVNRQVMERTFDEILAGSQLLHGYILQNQAGETAGFALLANSWCQEAGGPVLWIDEIFLKPEYRSLGLGKAFFLFVQRQYAGKVARIRLEADPGNSQALSLYQRLGYQVLPYVQLVRDCD